MLLFWFFNLGASWGGWWSPRPDRFTPWNEPRYPLYRRLHGPQVRPGPVQKISPPHRDSIPRTVHPIQTALSRPLSFEILKNSRIYEVDKNRPHTGVTPKIWHSDQDSGPAAILYYSLEHVEDDIYHKLRWMICSALYVINCIYWSEYWSYENTRFESHKIHMKMSIHRSVLPVRPSTKVEWWANTAKERFQQSLQFINQRMHI